MINAHSCGLRWGDVVITMLLHTCNNRHAASELTQHLLYDTTKPAILEKISLYTSNTDNYV